MALTAKTEFGKILVANLKANLVTKEKYIFNNDYEGDASFGQVMIPLVDEYGVADYNKRNIGSNAVSYEDNKFIPVVIDKDKFINRYFDKFDVHSVPYNMVVSGVERGAYALAAAEDVDGLTTLVKGVQGLARNGSAYGSGDPRNGKKGTVISKTNAAWKADDIYLDIVALKTALDKAHVPAQGRYIIASAEAQAKILLSDKALKAGQLNDEVVKRGVMAQIAGFDVYPSESMGNAGSDPVAVLAGHPLFATRIEYMVAEPALYSGESDANIVGGSLLKGRVTFTHEVVRPESFAMLTYKTA